MLDAHCERTKARSEADGQLEADPEPLNRDLDEFYPTPLEPEPGCFKIIGGHHVAKSHRSARSTTSPTQVRWDRRRHEPAVCDAVLALMDGDCGTVSRRRWGEFGAIHANRRAVVVARVI